MKVQPLIFIILCLMIGSCNVGSTNGQAESASVSGSKLDVHNKNFDADSAYRYIETQVSCGPRVPGTEGHRRCAEFIVSSLRRQGADTIIEQKTTVTAYNGDRLPINNIMARFNINAAKRVLLVAHWDTRPWADAEPDKSKHSIPIPGANDGGSGVGVLLEVARNLGTEVPNIGVDMLFTDAEDYGETGGDDDSWCLGTQYWVKNMPYETNRLPMYGILLDIVGGQNAKFHREYFSEYFAPKINTEIWAVAASSGYGGRFINETKGAVTDDHVYINQAGIPCVDIIECANPETGSFPPTWHTLNDDMNSIDRGTLKAVGQTVLNLIYKESK